LVELIVFLMRYYADEFEKLLTLG